MSSLKYKIPLFDIDWTLLKGGNKVHNAAFTFAFDKVYKLPNTSIDEINHHGMVDTQIFIEIPKLHGISEEEAKSKIPQALETMINYFNQHADEGSYKVMPGSLKLLKTLKSLKVPMGLLTGNTEEIGWEKLGRAGIRDFFSFGAFGSMVLKRIDLIPIAKKKAENLLGLNVSLQQLVIVGDSPRDIVCAKEAGISIIAVGAGVHAVDKLKEADLVVKSLEEKDKIIKFLSANT